MNMRQSICLCPIFLIGIVFFFSNGCKKDDSSIVTDIDGNEYHTVTIGNQIWMVENLTTTRYRNGDTIPNVIDSVQWSGLSSGAYCCYNNDEDTGAKYGKLYNGFAVFDSRNIAPVGWHVATDVDWSELEDYIATHPGNSGSVAKALSSKTDWATCTEYLAPGNDLSANNSSGFTALPGGGGGPFPSFNQPTRFGQWWTSTRTIPLYTFGAWVYRIGYGSWYLSRDGFHAGNGCSVRCVKDN